MKVLIILAVVSKVISSKEEFVPNLGKEPMRPNRGLYTNTKMVENGNLFSPRMEYDEWTPLGRGDPLKNDPTYDYVPPVLERVHYWMEPSKRTPDPPVLNSGILILGSSRTEPSPFSVTPKYPPKEPHADSRLDTMSLLDPFLKFMDVSKLGINLNSNGNNQYKPGSNQNRIHQTNYHRPVHQQHYYNHKYHQQQPQALQRPPYTMLMPPPPPSPTLSSSIMTFATVATTTEVTTTPLQTTTPGTTITGTTITKSTHEANLTTVYPFTTIIANTENLYKPVAIAMPEENETIRNAGENYQVKLKPDDATPGFTKQISRTPVPVQQQKRPVSESKSKGQLMQKPMHEEHPPRMQGTTTKQSHEEGYSTKWGIDNRATPAPPFTSTRAINTLTTDPMFKHYKQPSEPVKGPFYLIIQGHSKVKTYGANKNPINGLLTSNEIREDGEDRKDGYSDFYDLDSKEAKNRKRGKSLRWLTKGTNFLSDGERRKKFDKIDFRSPAISQLNVFVNDSENVENLEDANAFGKMEGSTSKKRYLPNQMINDASEEISRHNNRQLLSDDKTASTVSSPTMITVSHPTTTATGDNYEIESFIALNDDYTPEDVISLLLKEEGQGSGFGNLVFSIFGKSLKENT